MEGRGRRDGEGDFATGEGGDSRMAIASVLVAVVLVAREEGMVRPSVMRTTVESVCSVMMRWCTGMLRRRVDE